MAHALPSLHGLALHARPTGALGGRATPAEIDELIAVLRAQRALPEADRAFEGDNDSLDRLLRSAVVWRGGQAPPGDPATPDDILEHLVDFLTFDTNLFAQNVTQSRLIEEATHWYNAVRQPDTPDDPYSQALIRASANGDLARVVILCEIGADANARDSNGIAALSYASNFGHVDVVATLLEYDAEVDFQNDQALRRACWNGHLAVVEVLVANGANVNAIFERKTPLSIASTNGHLAVVEFLLENGADVRGETDAALVSASWNGHLAVVEFLLEHGAYLEADNGAALGYASRNGHLDVVEYLLDRGANIEGWNGAPLRWATNFNQLAVVRVLIARGADVNAQSSGGATALWYAIHNGNAEIEQALRDAGATGE